MGHLRTIRNGMFKNGNSIRGIRATTMQKVSIGLDRHDKKIWRKVKVRVRNMCSIGVGASVPIKHAKLIREYALQLRKRYSRVFLRGNK